MDTHYYLKVFRNDGTTWDDATDHDHLESAERAAREELKNGASEVHISNADGEVVKILTPKVS